MARLSFGPLAKKRAIQILQALIAYANDEIPTCSININVQLQEFDNDRYPYRLVVNNVTLARDLLPLVKFVFGTECKCKNKSNIQDYFIVNLKLLDLFEEENEESNNKGNRTFYICLWSKKTQENLEKFSELWDNYDYKKSKSPINSYSITSKSTPNPVPEPKISISQQFSDLLFLVNCTDQQSKFNQAITALTPNAIGTFLISTNEVGLQKCLVKRLAREVPGFDNAFCEQFDSYSSIGNLDYFWQTLAQRLNTGLTTDNLVDALSQVYRYQTVILVLYNINLLDDANLIKFMNFWQQLVQRVMAKPNRVSRNRLFLFLAEDCAENPNKVNYANQRQYPFTCLSEVDDQHLEYPLRLPYLSGIKPNEAEVWLDSNQVYPKLIKLLNEPRIDFLRQGIRTSSSRNMLDKICRLCGLENGIAEIEQYWKLIA